MANLKLDPIGYFLIRINKKTKKVEIGFCNYKDMVLGKSNKIKKKFSSKNPETILNWVKKNKLYSMQSHFNYLKKELANAKLCLENNKEYTQE